MFAARTFPLGGCRTAGHGERRAGLEPQDALRDFCELQPSGGCKLKLPAMSDSLKAQRGASVTAKPLQSGTVTVEVTSTTFTAAESADSGDGESAVLNLARIERTWHGSERYFSCAATSETCRNSCGHVT